MKNYNRTLTLYRPETYHIRVQGKLDENWFDWNDELTVTTERDSDGHPVTTLVSIVDQAALHGLLRRLYFLGLSLIYVIWVETG